MQTVTALELTFKRIATSEGEYTIDIFNKPLGLEFEDTSGDTPAVILKAIKSDNCKIEGCEELKRGDVLCKFGDIEVDRRTSVDVMKQLHEQKRPLRLHFKRVTTAYQESMIEQHVSVDKGTLGVTFEKAPLLET